MFAGGEGLASRNDGRQTISVISGTLNEKENIVRFIHQLLGTIPKKCDAEIVIVDDGSTDGTKELLAKEAEADNRVIPIFNTHRKGLLASNLQGLSVARGDIKIVMDCDMQHPPEKVPCIIENIMNGYDIVVCSRYIEGGTVGGRNPLRGLISRVAVLLAKIALHEKEPVLDNVSGYFGFAKHVVIPRLHDADGFKTLLYILAQNPSAKINEIPYAFQKRDAGKSKIVESWRFIPKFLLEIVSVTRISYRAKRTDNSEIMLARPDRVEKAANKE